MADSVTTAIAWKRAKSDSTHTSNRKTWESRCGHYQVQFMRSYFASVPDTYYSLVKHCGDCDSFSILGRHRKKSAAIKACEKHAKGK